jgi:hypothetical protein
MEGILRTCFRIRKLVLRWTILDELEEEEAFNQNDNCLE